MLIPLLTGHTRLSYGKKAPSATKMGELMARDKLVIANSRWGNIDGIFNTENVIRVKELS